MTNLKNTDKQLLHGLIVAYFGNSVAVETGDGQVFFCQLHKNQDLPVVGDKVQWQLETNDTGTVTKIETRHSLLTRKDNKGKEKAIAANIDAIVIVMSPPPIFSEYLIDRYIIAAELLKIKPIQVLIVLNKIDLLTEDAKEEVTSRLVTYQNINYEVILTSVYQKLGLQELNTKLANKTAVLVGPSGVGKSSIISALSDGDSIKIGDVSAKGMGKHTTTATRLYHLPLHTNLIDSPGVREFNLGSTTKNEILLGFKEFALYKNACKFRDCAHIAEPHCAVQTALAEGKISQTRYTNYLTLITKSTK